jgi:hypothetical protein
VRERAMAINEEKRSAERKELPAKRLDDFIGLPSPKMDESSSARYASLIVRNLSARHKQIMRGEENTFRCKARKINGLCQGIQAALLKLLTILGPQKKGVKS